MNEQNYEKAYDPIAARERRAAREKQRLRKQQRRRRMVRRLVALCLAVVLTVCVVPPLCNRAEQLLYPRKYEQLVEKWAADYELDPLLVYAFIRTESGFDPQATSSVDARGLMQMTEETFLWMRSKIAPEEPLTFADLYSPDTAIRFGWLLPAPLHGALQRGCIHGSSGLPQRLGHGGSAAANRGTLGRRGNAAGLPL